MHLWDDLDLDVVGVSAWFNLAETPPSTVTGVDRLRQEYERIFQDHLVPLAADNPGRPIVFTEYGAIDTVEGPADPSGFPETAEFVFSDLNGNGVDDGRETQANIRPRTVRDVAVSRELAGEGGGTAAGPDVVRGHGGDRRSGAGDRGVSERGHVRGVLVTAWGGLGQRVGFHSHGHVGGRGRGDRDGDGKRSGRLLGHAAVLRDGAGVDAAQADPVPGVAAADRGAARARARHVTVNTCLVVG